MISIKGTTVRELVLTLGKALEKEGECWQAGLFQSPLSSLDGITGAKRDNAVVWMLEKSDKLGFHPETWALAVTILDRFLHVVKAQAKYLQCIAITCLFIAAKFSEEDEALLTAAELVRMSQCGCTASDVVRMERIVVDKLQWNVRAATTLEFMQIFQALLMSSDADTFTDPLEVCAQLDALTTRVRQCVGYHKLLGFRPSTLALSILSLELEEHAGAGWLPTTMGLQRLASIDNLSLIQCREKISYLLPSLNHSVIMPPQLSRPVKRKMRSESESSTPGDEEMYDGIKRLYGSDDDFVLPVACGMIGCAAEALQQPAKVTREMASAVAN